MLYISINNLYILRKRKKSQVWLNEFAFAIFIFLVAFAVFYKVMPSVKMNAKDPFEDVYLDAKAISAMLFTKGSPKEWNTTNVNIVGLMDDGRNISTQKVEMFRNLSSTEYNQIRLMFGIQSYYVVYFLNSSDLPIEISSIKEIGHKGVGIPYGNSYSNVSLQNPKNLARIERIAIYNRLPIKVVVETWN